MSRKQLELYRATLPLPGRALKVSYVDIHTCKEGPCGIFLHGGGGNLTQWHNQLVHLSPRMRCVAYDFRGHGCSEAPEGEYDVPELVEDLNSVIEALDLPERFFLLGHSFGGAVAAHYAASRPERLNGLVLIATAGKIKLSAMMTGLLKLPTFALGPVSKLIRNQISSPVPVLKKMIPNLIEWRGWDLYPKIPVRTLVVSGEYDRLTRTKAMRDMADQLTDSWFERISFAGHLPHLERPARVNEILDQFLFGEQKSWRSRG